MEKKEIKKEFAHKFIAKYKDYNVIEKTEHWNENGIKNEGIYLIIKNLNGEDIELMYDGNHVGNGEMILSCSRWHMHFFDFHFPKGEEKNYADYFISDLSEYIDKILQGTDLKTL